MKDQNLLDVSVASPSIAPVNEYLFAYRDLHTLTYQVILGYVTPFTLDKLFDACGLWEAMHQGFIHDEWGNPLESAGNPLEISTMLWVRGHYPG